MIELKAPAKINWFLRVFDLRHDGFHEIVSLMQKVSLYDVLTFQASEDLSLRSDQKMPVRQNLVYRTAQIFRREFNIAAGAEIGLTKNIPEAAGLGGGSSDAAATLLGLNELWSLGLSKDELRGVAERIGSDVPFFLDGPLALVEGRGEIITEHNARRTLDVLLVKPDINVSTRWAYENYDRKRASAGNPDLTTEGGRADNTHFFIEAVNNAQFDISHRPFNDLESVTVTRYPVIAGIKEKMIERGAVLSLMSGSGPTVYGVFGSPADAERASKLFENCWTAVVRTIID